VRQFRKGDIVTIECVVESQFTDTEMRVRPVDDHSDIYVKIDQVKVVRQAIEVGDFVRNTETSTYNKGTVHAVHDGLAWVELTSGSYNTWDINYCRRLEPVEAQVAA